MRLHVINALLITPTTIPMYTIVYNADNVIIDFCPQRNNLPVESEAMDCCPS